MVPALPRDEDGERLDVLNRELQDQRRGAEGVGVEIEENQTPQFRRLLASQQTALDVPNSDAVSSAAAATTHSAN